MSLDTLIKGGHLVDPAQSIDGRADVALSGDRVAAIALDIPTTAARRVIDATGHHVLPGLVDLHAHIFRGIGYFGLDADPLACRTGVTTWVDAGSAGAFTLPGFRDLVAASTELRVRAFMNISYLGLVGLNYDEYCNLDACDPELFQVVAEANRELVVGVKVRIGKGRVGNQELEPLRRALAAAEVTGLPVMAHIAAAPPDVAETLGLLRPGDIVTHSYTGQSARLVDDDGMVREAARRARDRGVLFDVGHGSGSFSFDSAAALTGAGFWPDVISTDLHSLSVHGENLHDPLALETMARVRGDGGPALTLPIVIEKFLALGMRFSEAIRAVTATPAAILGLAGEVGTLRPGAYADVGLFAREEGRFPLTDVHGDVREGHERLRNTLTIVGGRELAVRPMPAPPPWITADPA